MDEYDARDAMASVQRSLANVERERDQLRAELAAAIRQTKERDALRTQEVAKSTAELEEAKRDVGRLSAANAEIAESATRNWRLYDAARADNEALRGRLATLEKIASASVHAMCVSRSFGRIRPGGRDCGACGPCMARAFALSPSPDNCANCGHSRGSHADHGDGDCVMDAGGDADKQCPCARFRPKAPMSVRAENPTDKINRPVDSDASPPAPEPRGEAASKCYQCAADADDTCPLCGRHVCRACAEREGESCCDADVLPPGWTKPEFDASFERLLDEPAPASAQGTGGPSIMEPATRGQFLILQSLIRELQGDWRALDKRVSALEPPEGTEIVYVRPGHGPMHRIAKDPPQSAPVGRPKARCGHTAYREHTDMCIEDSCPDAAYQSFAPAPHAFKPHPLDDNLCEHDVSINPEVFVACGQPRSAAVHGEGG